ncbi:MAG: heavy metal response regulator transcription factor [Methylomonas sp.]|jgi:two-component system copper resistance phosphate regulon response regulator CusR|uniref:heavy metal response regulator transcription factor n=1 Tax=Methylomonas sp. TaxID=418 RepID=UPI0025DCB0C9|nr:heavy metal response regulator transcription factor [Methylomonas sp.]MCK9607470.1 heavy metal response regulator transcription factor [Methylomonas sp.]
MRILIVEDEKKTAAYLQKGLSEQGFIVDVCHDGEEGLLLANDIAFDLILLDVMMPLRDGWSVLQALREQGKQTPVLFLTAKDNLEDKVKGLELGADDYLVKPFAFVELLARIRSILRRGPVRPSTQLSLADLTMDPIRHKAYRQEQRLDLSPKEFALLLLFLQRPGEVLSRTLIAEQIWDIHFDSDTNIIDVAIRRLRQKIDDPFAEKLLHTVRGMGYVLEQR